MPHDHLAHLSGCHHTKRMKGSPFEHNTHMTATPIHGVEEVVRKEKRLAGLRE